MARNTPAQADGGNAELRTFQQAVADAFLKLAVEQSASRENAWEQVALAGVRQAKVVAGDGGALRAELPEAGEENYGGRPASDLTPAALQRERAAALGKLRRSVWNHIREMNEYGQLNGDRTIALLEELGYGAAYQPKLQTTIEFSVRNEDTGQAVGASVVVEGRKDRDEVRAALDAQFPSTVIAQVQGMPVFRGAEVKGTTSRVRNFGMRSDPTWPDYPAA